MARVWPGRGQLARALDAPIQPGLRSLKKRKGSSEARGNRCQQLQPLDSDKEGGSARWTFHPQRCC